MKLRRALPLLCAALAVCALAIPAAAQARMEIAVQDDSVLVYGQYGNPQIALTRARALGATWVRMNVSYEKWHEFGRATFVAAVNRARHRHMRVELVLMGQPRKPHPGPVGYYRPSIRAFSRFSTEVARAMHGKVRRWSIWNEPNLPLWLSPRGSAPRLYCQLFRAGDRALRRVDHRNQVLVGELSSLHSALTFIDRAGRACGRGGIRADGFAYHPYQPNVAPGARDRHYNGISNLAKVKAALRRLARKHRLRTRHGGTLPLYLTEFGYPARSSAYYPIRESRRASWYPKALVVARRARVRQFGIYQLYTPPRSLLRQHIWNSGILTESGRALPSYTALLRAHRRHAF